ncbi:MAG TPA: hypothetical protein VK453_00950 [Micromonosporaceae bacterium]|nr:hypothetical protein [Micromonosporaceae bacterium]
MATADQGGLSALARQVELTAVERFPDVYAGVMLLPDPERIRVYRKPSADLDRWLTDEFGPGRVEVVDAAHSQRELRALQERIADDFGYWRSRGLTLNSVASTVDGRAVEVGTSDVERARRDLPGHYGVDAAITVVAQGEIRTL